MGDTFHRPSYKRSGSSRDRAVILAHCIMNQSTRASWEGGGASSTESEIEKIITPLLEYGVGIIQMDCPEQSLYGNPRPPMSRDDYDTPESRRDAGRSRREPCTLLKLTPS